MRPQSQTTRTAIKIRPRAAVQCHWAINNPGLFDHTLVLEIWSYSNIRWHLKHRRSKHRRSRPRHIKTHLRCLRIGRNVETERFKVSHNKHCQMLLLLSFIVRFYCWSSFIPHSKAISCCIFYGIWLHYSHDVQSERVIFLVEEIFCSQISHNSTP